jgi:hypothetical protein
VSNFLVSSFHLAHFGLVAVSLCCILPLAAVDHLFKHYQWYKNDTLEAASTFLSACMNSETYGTDKVSSESNQFLSGHVLFSPLLTFVLLLPVVCTLQTKYVANQEVMTKLVGLKGASACFLGTD